MNRRERRKRRARVGCVRSSWLSLFAIGGELNRWESSSWSDCGSSRSSAVEIRKRLSAALQQTPAKSASCGFVTQPLRILLRCEDSESADECGAAVAFSRRLVAVKALLHLKALPSSAAESHRYEAAAQSRAIPSGSDSSAPIPLPVLRALLLWVK